MTSPYKRRRPSLVRNLWIYRRLVGLAVVLGLLLWFIWANNAPVTVTFPFRLGAFQSTTGLVILISALAGSSLTAVAMMLLFAVRQIQSGTRPVDEPQNTLPDDRPPADYAAKAAEAAPPDDWV
ncbi:MAG: LapA family protein [Isosphaeraceae bacterium]